MPFYEYYCKKCDKSYEFFQGISEDPKTNCEVCDGKLKKLISLSSFHLKGTGWYTTDYAKGNGQGTASIEKTNGDAKSKENKENKKKSKPEKTTEKKAPANPSKESVSNS